MDRARLITLVPSALLALLELDYQFLELAVCDEVVARSDLTE